MVFCDLDVCVEDAWRLAYVSHNMFEAGDDVNMLWARGMASGIQRQSILHLWAC
jgi:hypothetical protein